MRRRGTLPLFWLGVMLAVVSVLAACTKGGQFDPTTLLDNDMFDNKKPVQGQREPVFPNGVPGATTGIPADLYKGYQPPQQAADNAGAATPIAPQAVEAAKPEARLAAKPKPKAKPKTKVARAPPPPRTEISVGLRKQSTPASQQQTQSAPTVWPAPPSTAQTAWPAPPSTSQSSQTVWPAPPPAGGAQQSAPPAQSIWPNPPPTGSQ